MIRQAGRIASERGGFTVGTERGVAGRAIRGNLRAGLIAEGRAHTADEIRERGIQR